MERQHCPYARLGFVMFGEMMTLLLCLLEFIMYGEADYGKTTLISMLI